MSQAVFTAKALTKTYVSGEVTVHAVNKVDLEIAENEVVVLLGPSGSGKTTLLNIMGGLLPDPTAGTMTGKGSCYKASPGQCCASGPTLAPTTPQTSAPNLEN